MDIEIYKWLIIIALIITSKYLLNHYKSKILFKYRKLLLLYPISCVVLLVYVMYSPQIGIIGDFVLVGMITSIFLQIYFKRDYYFNKDNKLTPPNF